MWETSNGVRTLDGAEAFLVRELIHYLLDQILVGIEINEPHRADVPVFDALQPTQQLWMLRQVASGLLDPMKQPVALSATNEATIYALFCELRSLIEIEIDYHRLDPHGLSPNNAIRIATFDAWMQHQHWRSDDQDGEPEDKAIPTVQCQDMDQWTWFVELIADQILWDRDFDLDGLVGDIPPEHANLLKRQLGIQSDYYSTIAPDVLDVDVTSIVRQIHDLVPSSSSQAIDFKTHR